MKNLVLFFLILFSCFWGCSNKLDNNPVSTSEKGKILLKIDSENAPSDVEFVDATLNRNGFETITASLNLITGSTADILIEDIAAGIWHLKVDAKDTDSLILYTGETDIEILAGFVTQVYLTLNPTGIGNGSIYIFVTWGVNNIGWSDYELNPILQTSGSNWDLEGVAQPKVLILNSSYKMYYAGYAGAGYTHVGYAESNDGVNWTRPTTDPVLSPGLPGTWDSYATIAGAVIFDDGQYKMYYVGWSDTYANWHIGLATSTDGLSWSKYTQPVLFGSSGWEFQIIPSAILKVDGVYYLYYFGRNIPEYKIGLATSVDGINWTRYSGNPILTNTKPWEESGIFHPTVIREDNQFKMVYMNSSATGFGFAYSSDGMNWIKDNSNPFFTNDETSNDWAAYKIAYPNYIKLAEEYRIYYTGYESSDWFPKIGFTRKFVE